MRSKLKNVFAGVAGNALEWFDFTLYAFFVHNIASAFFPTKNNLLALILAFGVFATGFLIRPIGGWLIGLIGDHFGRKRALIFTSLLMSFATIAIAFLPGYLTLGIAAPIILTLVRLIQGFAISGELNTSANFLIEYLPHTRRGLSGSLVMAASFLGIVLSAVVAAVIILILPSEKVAQFGWRIPFLIAGVLGCVIFMLRLKMIESPVFLSKYEGKKQLLPILLKHWRLVVLGIFLTSLMAVANYFLIGYFPAFLQTQGFSAEFATTINAFVMFIFVGLIILSGILSDKIGRKPLLMFGAFSFIVFSYPIFWLLSQHSSLFVFIAEFIFVIILAPVAGIIPTVLAEFFPTKIRNTGVAMSYNICLAIFGGTAPMIAFTLVKVTSSTLFPAWYLIGCAALTLLAIFIAEESYKKELD